MVAAAMRAEVAGYLLKHVRGPALVAAVRGVGAGGTVFAPEVAAAMFGPSARHRPDPLSALTERERVVLQLLGEGLSNRHIGARLGLAERTVKNYTSQVLGLQRRTQDRLAVRGAEVEDPSPGSAAVSRGGLRGGHTALVHWSGGEGRSL
jgi:DNA-binding NarL/FixJ family response regulator